MGFNFNIIIRADGKYTIDWYGQGVGVANNYYAKSIWVDTNAL